jgi:hypothetical protein
MSGTGLSPPTILPQKNTEPPFSPDFNVADSLALPSEIGVRNGNTVQSVVDAAKGMAFYIDTIGFGQSTTSLTGGFGDKLIPLGLNTYLESGEICSNGAKMWKYVTGIPQGDALGKTIGDRMAAAGLPRLRGLAPGMLEDAKEALNPVPLAEAVFGSSYPVCIQQSNPVGDQSGNVKNPSTGKWYVANPETVTCSNRGSFNMSTGKCSGGKPQQTRWVQGSRAEKGEYDATTKDYCPDGYSKSSHISSDCNKALTGSAFTNMGNDTREWRFIKVAGAVVGVLCLVVVADYFLRKSKLKRK